MAFTQRRLWYRVKIDGAWVTTRGDVRISESVDQLSRVAEFDIAEQPASEPAEGDTVLIEQFDFDEGTVTAVFGGTVNAISAESQPWSLTCTCTDQLRLLDRVRQGTDLDLTGMTPKEALMAVLDDVGCTYDAADLADPVYELGEREPVKWHVSTPGSQITNELSVVFGCVLLTVGNDRILWLSHDSTPADGTGSYATYTKGTSIGFGGHGRVHGERSRIQNNWKVTGPAAQISKQCTATVVADAVGTNPQLGRRRFVAEQTFHSDLIQSEDLAEAIVRRLMRETNRLPDERTTPMVNDVNVHPASKLTIVDPTYGLGGTSYVTVLAVDRTGSRMTLRLAAGPGGSEGTVTTGVDKVCNDTHTDLDWPGDGFDFPDFDFPPIDLGDPIDFDLDLDIPPLFTPDLGGGTDVPYTAIGGTEPEPGGECLDAIGPDDESDWFTDLGSAISITGGVLTCDEGSSAINTAIVIGWDDDWQLTAVVDGSVVGAGDPEPSLGVVTSVAFGVGAFIAMYDDGASFDVGTGEGGVESHLSQPFDVQSPMIWTLTRLGTWFFWSITQGANHAQGSIAWGTPTETGDLAIRVLSNSESFALSDAQFCTGVEAGETIDTPNWTALVGSWTFGADDEAHNSETSDSDAYAAGHVFTGTERARWRGVVNFNASEETIFSFLLDDTEGTPTGDICGFQVYVSASPQVDVYTFDGFQETLALDLSGGFVFAFDADPGSNEFRMSLNEEAHVYTLGTWPGDKTIHIEHGSGTVVDLDVTDMTIVAGG